MGFQEYTSDKAEIRQLSGILDFLMGVLRVLCVRGRRDLVNGLVDDEDEEW